MAVPLSATAAGLGPIVQQSSLGQPLRVIIPVLLGPGEDIAAECFRLVGADRDPDGVPQVTFGRVTLERTGESARIVVSHQRPINDPVLRLTVAVGCDAGVRREYTLLLDPPVIDLPLAVDEVGPARSPPPLAAPTRPAPRRASERAAAAGAAAGTAAGTAAARKPSTAKPKSAAKAPPRRPPAPAADDTPRLKVSRAQPPLAGDAAKPAGPTAQEVQAQQELADALEAETVVLRQRVAELSALVDRMQEQVRAQEEQQRAAEQAAKAAEEAARASPWSVAARWWSANWLLVILIVGLPVLIAGVLLWRRRANALPAGPWHFSGMPSQRADVASPLAERPLPSTSAVNPAGSRGTAPARAGTSALAVSELSQVTEEARVYIALGHTDRAINVLREHVRHAPRAVPAAWLMLLDLYHANGRRQEFREVAQEFHHRCNVQAPTWEAFATLGHDAAGLEDYPHVTRRIAGCWRTAECRDYLEQLLHDNRDGRRAGFSLAAYGDILTLLHIVDAPMVDIDSDLAEEERLRTAWNAAVKEAGLNGTSHATGSAGPKAAAPAASAPNAGKPARPTQDSLVFELDPQWRTRGSVPER